MPLPLPACGKPLGMLCGSSPQPVENSVYNLKNPDWATDFAMTNLFPNDKSDDKTTQPQEVRCDQA